MAWPKSGRRLPAMPKVAAPKMSTVGAPGVPKMAAPRPLKLTRPAPQVRALHVPKFNRPTRIGQLVEPPRPHPHKNLGPYLHPSKPKM